MTTFIDSQIAQDSVPNASEAAESITTTETPTDVEFTRALVDSFGNRVRITDTDPDSGLELICYVKCSPEDNSHLRNCRGVVFNGDQVVMKAFPYTIEYSETDYEQIKDKLSDITQFTCFDSHEGTLVRMFYFADKWYTSTHRKLNAFRSKWASRESFGTALKNALQHEADTNEGLQNVLDSVQGENILEKFQNTLDTEKQYMFLVRNTQENRIVCKAPDTGLMYHVGTFVEGVLVMTEDCKIPYPQQHNFQNIEDMLDFVADIDIHNRQGVILFAPNNMQYKILNNSYQELFRARGNEPSIKFRYLQVRMNRKYSDMLHHLYPEQVPVFKEYENALYQIAKTIHSSYIQRHIKGRWSQLPNEEYAVDKSCHAWHEKDHKNNRVKLEVVIDHLNEQSATALNKMIRRYQEGNTTQKQVENTVKTRNRSNTLTNVQMGNLTKSTPTTSPLLLGKYADDNVEELGLEVSV